MIRALEKSMGVISTACSNVGITRQTHYNWLEKDPKYAAEVDAINEKSIDFAESKLFQLINGVEIPETKVFLSEGTIITHDMKKKFAPDTAATIFYLKTKGKKRGYIEKQDIGITDKNGNDISTFAGITTDKLKKIEQILSDDQKPEAE